MKKIEAIILTAGYSSRMGQDKALVLSQEKTFLEHLVDKIAPCASIINFIVGHHRELIESFIKSHFQHLNYNIIFNPHYPQGMFTSIQCGFNHVSGKYPILLQMIDQPFIMPESYLKITNHFDDSMLILQPTDQSGKKGHPILFNQRFIKLIQKHQEAETLRDLMRIYYPEKHYLMIDDPGIFQNINTPDLIKN